MFLPKRFAAISSSLDTSPPPIATITSLFSTMAVEVGDSRSVPGVNPPQDASLT